ncbi:hypothetical protein [Dyadobacter sp. 676]|uniref:DUF3575 domain-containing protein n=1 Tax=Dyadobacter sp. 676 TaxID=3088362 RepID=A0AAU8FN99_9BACT
MRFAIIVILACLSHYSVAQFDVESARRHVIVKYSPLPMLDLDNTIQFGVEIPLGKGNFALQQDLGYGPPALSSWRVEQREIPDKQTFKSRTHLRWYFVEKRRMRAYMGPEVLYKKVAYRENQWIGRDCVGGFGPCSFFQNQDVRLDKNVVAGHARIGWQFITPSRLTIDLFTGVGFRHISTASHTPGIPDWEIRRIYDGWEYHTPGESDFRPSIVAGVHFGIVLGKYSRD